MSSLFQAVQGGLGVSVTPTHFYFPVPNLKSFRDKDWKAARQCAGIDFNYPRQIELAEKELAPFAAEWTFPEVANGDARNFHFNNGFFERVDVEVAYSLVRRNKPKRVIEVGSGNSTKVLAAALKKNAAEGAPGELISIEPYPAPYLKDGMTQLLEQPVQQVPIELFRTLQRGDILFIDSSHVVSLDSDVLYELLQIMPALASGVLIHFHDIFTPLDYPKKFVMTNLCFWGEQYMLEAFMSFNSAFRVVWASSAMQQYHPEVVQKVFPGWNKSYERMPDELRVFSPTLDDKNVWPCSFWIEKN